MDLTLTGMAYGGDAFGRNEQGEMVFVPFALPGERVRVEVVEAHKRWCRGRLLDILESSPARQEPRCPHFGLCGGCHYQHMSYDDQLTIKSEILQSQFERIGGLKNPPILPILPSPSPWNTRNHIQFSLTPFGQLGFVSANENRVFAVEECHLPEPTLGDLWPRIQFESIGGLERVALRAGADDERLIIMEADRDPDVEVAIDLTASIVWRSPTGSFVLAGESSLPQDVLGRRFRVSAGSFFQVHTAMSEKLVRNIVAALEVTTGDTVFDLYAGVGLFSTFLAEAGVHVVAVETSPWACSDFDFNLDEFDNVELYEAPVETALPAIPKRADAVLVDPPRAGLSKEVLQQLIDRSPKRLVYLSCDTATLARDSKRLIEGGFHLDRATPIDLFPQTYHIETLTVWSR
jgi:23S rRNA (uracil1939-C5)-methyltransferase